METTIAAVIGATPNPSIKRTSPGKPGFAAYVKRWLTYERG
ncbi:MAG: hypothetical protein ABIU05_05740 [Nitrospirales bacterium]